MRGVIGFALCLALCLLSCSRKEGVLGVVHQTLDEARTRPRVQIDLFTEKENPSPAELQLQQALEKRIEQEHVGTVVNDGSGPGYLRIVIEVGETVVSTGKLRSMLHDAGVLDHASVKVVQP